MLILISPAKTLDFESEPATERYSEPRFLDASRKLVERMREHSPDRIASLMKISDKLAELNHRRYTEWHTPFTPDNARQAVLAFRGDVYTGLEADHWRDKDFEWAQDHLRILSGLYGVLRPLDLIQPYRLEMGTALSNPAGKDLYAFWREIITDALRTDLEALPTPVLQRVLRRRATGRTAGEDRHPGVPGPEERQLQGHQLLRQEGPRPDGQLDHPQPGEEREEARELRRRRLPLRRRRHGQGTAGRAGVPAGRAGVNGFRCGSGFSREQAPCERQAFAAEEAVAKRSLPLWERLQSRTRAPRINNLRPLFAAEAAPTVTSQAPGSSNE
jgi:hypothetical protein